MTLSEALQLFDVAPPHFEVRNPANLEVLAHVQDVSDAALAEIVQDADQARQDWAGRPSKARSALLHRWYELIVEHRELLAELVTAESGKPLNEARGEVDYGAAFVQWYAEEAKRAYGSVIPGHASDKRMLTIRQPIGVCAAITPWNFPLAMITRKVGPALAAGCPIIVKPAEATPLTALMLERLAQQAGIPEAVFRVVATADPQRVGEFLCASDKIRKLSFTGSTRVGKILLAKCADTVKRVSMELGGNAPFIVFEDADLDKAVAGAIAAKFRNAGQTCVCANRILVEDSIYEPFTAALADEVKALKTGDGAEADTQIGPLINQAAIEKVEALVDDALSGGGEVLTGGVRLSGDGHFFEPTVLSEIRPQMKIATQEVFGPVAPVIRFKGEEDAISIANDTPYGLAAYLYTKDVSRAWRAMEALEYGMVGLNEGIISNEAAPFGGVKQSGIGREGGREGLDEYLETKYVMLNIS